MHGESRQVQFVCFLAEVMRRISSEIVINSEIEAQQYSIVIMNQIFSSRKIIRNCV